MKTAYRVILEKTGTGFSAYAPDLPGCVATGKDEKATLKTMKAAMQFHLDGLKLDGQPIPKPKSTKWPVKKRLGL